MSSQFYSMVIGIVPCYCQTALTGASLLRQILSIFFRSHLCGRCIKKDVGIFSQQGTASGNSMRINLANTTKQITYSLTVKIQDTKKKKKKQPFFSFHDVI